MSDIFKLMINNMECILTNEGMIRNLSRSEISLMISFLLKSFIHQNHLYELDDSNYLNMKEALMDYAGIPSGHVFKDELSFKEFCKKMHPNVLNIPHFDAFDKACESTNYSDALGHLTIMIQYCFDNGYIKLFDILGMIAKLDEKTEI